MEAHIAALLPTQNRVVSADENTAFLAHYDLNEHDVLRNVNSIGRTKASQWANTFMKATGSQYGFTDVITMSAWIYPTGVPGSDRGALIIGNNGYYFTIDTAYHLSTYWYGRSPAGYHTSTGTCPLNTWTHVAVVWDLSGANLYINGVLDKTVDSTGVGAAPSFLHIGTESGGARKFVGKVNDLGIWNAAKSQSEIVSIMNNGVNGNESGLRGFWKMDEGTGSLLRDSSPFHTDIVCEPTYSFAWTTGSSVFTLRPTEGYFGGGAIAVEEGTTNIVSSQAVAGHGSSWVKTNETFQGNDVYRNTVTSPSTGNNFGFTSSTAYGLSSSVTNITLSFWVKVITDPGSLTGYIAVDYTDGTTTQHPWTYTPNPFGNAAYLNKWTKVTSTITLTAGKTPSRIARWYVYRDNATQGMMDVSMIQMETKSFATSYVNGTRSIGKLVYPKETLNTSSFTFNTWVKLNSLTNVAKPVFELSSSITQRLMLSYQSSTNKLGLWNTGQMDIMTNIVPVVGEWHMVTVTFNGTTYRIYYNGVEAASGDRSIYAATSSDLLYIGGFNVGTLNGLIDEVRIDNVARTADEIAAWYYSNSPFWPRGIYRKPY